VRIRTVAEPRRWAAFRCYGIYGQIMEVQAFVEDLEGALDAGQLPVAKFAGLSVIRYCLSLRCLLAEGPPPDVGDAMADLFAGLSEAETHEALTVARRLALAADLDEVRAAAGGVFAYVRDFERDLGFTDKPPSVRRAEGLFPALRLAREIIPINRAAHLPLALPSEWLPRVEPTAPTSQSDQSGTGDR
jgi:hypothetical protein